MPRSLIGKWVGGPNNLPIVLQVGTDGCQGKFKCPSGRWGQIDGLIMKGGARIKGTFTDPDEGGGGGGGGGGGSSPYGARNTIDITIDSSGLSWTASVTRASGRSERWTAKKPTWRKSSNAQVWYKDKKAWERLLSTSLSRNQQWLARKRGELLKESLDEGPRRRQHALLCESAPLATGEPYSGRSATLGSRHRGRSFQAGTSRHARESNGYFSQPKPLASGDKYVDATERRRRALAAKRAKQHSFDRPTFRPSGVRPTREADGAFLAEVDKTSSAEEVQALLKRAAASKTRAPIKEVRFGPRNFLTKPPRRGHYGQPGSLLGHRTEESRKLFEAPSEPYGRKEELEREQRRRARKVLQDRDLKPFCSANSRSSKPFTSDASMYKGVAPGGPPPRRRRRPQSAPSSGRALTSAPHASAHEDRPVWRPNNPGRAGAEGAFGGVPAYIPDPDAPRQLKDADEVGQLTWAHNATGKPPRPVNTVMLHSTNVRRIIRNRPASARPMRRPVRSGLSSSTRGS